MLYLTMPYMTHSRARRVPSGPSLNQTTNSDILTRNLFLASNRLTTVPAALLDWLFVVPRLLATEGCRVCGRKSPYSLRYSGEVAAALMARGMASGYP